MIDAKLGNFTLNSNKSITNTTDIRWDINDLFRITGNFNIAVSEGNGEKYISPDSKAFKDETDITKKDAWKSATAARWTGRGISTALSIS